MNKSEKQNQNKKNWRRPGAQMYRLYRIEFEWHLSFSISRQLNLIRIQLFIHYIYL